MSTRSLIKTLAVAALTVGATAVGAQATGARGFVAAGGAAGASANRRQVPLVAARALIAAHHPEALNGTLDPVVVTLVLDTTFNYIASSVSQPAVVVRSADGSGVAAAGGFATVGAVATARPTSAPTSAEAGASPSAASATMTIAGIGPIDSKLVDQVFTVIYPAGELATNSVRVRYVLLKMAPK